MTDLRYAHGVSMLSRSLALVASLVLVLTVGVEPAQAKKHAKVVSFGLEMADPCTTGQPGLDVQVDRIWDDRCNSMFVHWKDVETSRGVYDWSQLDQIVAQGMGREIIYTIGDVPGWANGNSSKGTPPLNYQDAYDFAAALAARYQGRIAEYELWNEFNMTDFWTGSVADMVTMTNGLSKAIKTADPNALTVMPSSTASPSALNSYLATCRSSGNKACYGDINNVHGYMFNMALSPNNVVPEEIWNLTSVNQSLFTQYGLGSRPFYVDEGGIIAGAITATKDQQAFASIWQLLLLSGGASTVVWHSYDDPFDSVVPLWNGQVCNNGKRCLNAVGKAYNATNKWLRNAAFLTPILRLPQQNQIRNPNAAGAIVGAPGQLPTNWQLINPDANHGISTQVVGVGTENGIPYLDFRVFGTLNAGTQSKVAISFENNTQITVSPAQMWTTGAFIKQVAGNTSGLSHFYVTSIEVSSSGGFLGYAQILGVTPTTSPLQQDLNAYSVRASNQSTAFIVPGIEIGYSVGVPIDITIRIGAPSVDNGTVWQGTISKPSENGKQALIAWDAAGATTSSQFSVPPVYTRCARVDKSPCQIVEGVVNLTNLPVLFDTP